MSSLVKIKVRPNQTLQFPSLCVHCAQPGAEKMMLRKRNGRITRLIDVPLCATCAQTLGRQSADEERIQKISWLVTGVVSLVALAVGLLLTPTALAFATRLLIALGITLLVALASLRLFRRAHANAALPAKKSILAAARITTFSWRATTFEFTNETFTERFRRLNENLLMEI